MEQLKAMDSDISVNAKNCTTIDQYNEKQEQSWQSIRKGESQQLLSIEWCRIRSKKKKQERGDGIENQETTSRDEALEEATTNQKEALEEVTATVTEEIYMYRNQR